MQHHQTFLRCSRKTAIIIILTIFVLFLAIGCAAMLRKAGLTPDEADRQAAIAQAALTDAAAEAVANIQTGLAQGDDLKTIAIKTGSAFAWKIAALAASTIGAVLSALLAKWLGTERKINQVLITGIEKTANQATKETIHNKATAAGIEPQLHARVKALT